MDKTMTPIFSTAGAPIMGNQADWNSRIKLNIDVLLKHAILDINSCRLKELV